MSNKKSASQPTARRTGSRARYTIVLIFAIHKMFLESLCGDISGQNAANRYNKLESITIEKSQRIINERHYSITIGNYVQSAAVAPFQ